MTEAAQIADKINAHIASGGRVYSIGRGGVKQVGNAFADGISLMVFYGRARNPVCLLPNVAQDLRREWRNVAFR